MNSLELSQSKGIVHGLDGEGGKIHTLNLREFYVSRKGGGFLGLGLRGPSFCSL